MRPNIFSCRPFLASRSVTPRSTHATCVWGAAAQHLHPSPLLGISPSDAEKSPCDFCAGRGGPTHSLVAITWNIAQQRQEVLARLLCGARRPNIFSHRRCWSFCPATSRSPRAASAQGAVAQHLHLSPSIGMLPRNAKKSPSNVCVGRDIPNPSSVTVARDLTQ